MIGTARIVAIGEALTRGAAVVRAVAAGAEVASVCRSFPAVGDWLTHDPSAATTATPKIVACAQFANLPVVRWLNGP
jgi:hypothetical protein